MDFSAAQQVINNLEKSLDLLEFLLMLATALVVVGLLLEYWHEIPESAAAFKRSWQSTLRRLAWKPLLIVGGALLITLGVAGELTIQFIASGKETSLRKANDSTFAGLRKEASDAFERASKADERASKADERSTANEKEAARLGRLAEKEHLERVKLEAMVAPRSLSIDQQKLIKTALSGFRGHNVLLTSYGTDGEAAVFGAQLVGVLRSAGINVADSRASTIVAGGFDIGIHVRGPETEHEFISHLSTALTSIGKFAVAVNDPSPKTGAGMGGGGQGFPGGTVFVSVMVGVKPVPVLPLK